MSLVPDYDSESDDDASSVEDEKVPLYTANNASEKSIVLPSATELLHGNTNTKGGVFNNPYKEAELAFSASLSKHVEMVDTDNNLQMKNGKKICWNYRKGRCRFASNCTFAHDSDLHELNRKQNNYSIEINKSTTNNVDTINARNHTDNNNKSTDLKSSSNSAKAKRPGLSNSLHPSKKVMKIYKAQNK